MNTKESHVSALRTYKTWCSRLTALLFFLSLGIFTSLALAAGAPSTSDISYQGLLKNAGTAANGSYDFEFGLWDSQVNGSQVGSTILVEDVSVVDGIFQVELDFGAASFDGSLRWLEIRVALANNGLTTLSPRQRVTATPYAVYALQPPGGGGGTLDQAYDSGGPGGGREIIADAGEVNILGPDGLYSDGGFFTDTTLAGAADGVFDIQARHRFGVLDGEPPLPSTVGSWILDGSILNQVEKWAHLRVASEGNSIRRNSGSWLRFQVEAVPNSTAFATTQMALTASGDLGLGVQEPVSRFHISGGSDATLAGGGYFVIGSVNSTNIIMDNNEILARDNGQISRLSLNNNGGDVTVAAQGGGNLGVGTSAPRVKAHVQGFPDVAVDDPDSGGLVLGSTGSSNIAMDSNEIMARNNGNPATLFLNNDGGSVVAGDDLVVNGTLDIGYQILSASSTTSDQITVNCTSGKKAIGGGMSMAPAGEYRASYPTGSGSGWFCQLEHDGPAFTCYAICARVE